MILIKKHREKNNKKLILFSYIIAIIFIFLLIFTTLYFVGAYKYDWGHFGKVGILHPLFLVFFFYLYFRALVLLHREMRNIKLTYHERTRIKYVFFAFTVALIGAYDFIPHYGVNIYPFAHIFILPFVLMTTYAILKHHLMDINVVIRRTLTYSFLITLITIVYFLVVFLTEKTVSRIFGYTTLPMTIVAATIIAVFFIPIKNRVQCLVDRICFKGTLDTLAQEKELMQQELIRSERLKAVATLAAGMAHEIKNPLTAIKTFTEHLKEKKDDPEFISKFERIVGGETDKINRIVHQLLDFAKPAPLQLGTTNLNHLLDDTLSLLSNDIIKHKIKLIKEYCDIPDISADANQLKQAFLNLLLNAIEAMPNGGNLTLRTSKNVAKNKTEVVIQDTGLGISKKDLSHIFDPFYSTKDKGTGLGLSITYEIIKKHNGSIVVESEAKAGTTVRVGF
jgi:signal transduction histidine kinase